MSDQEFAEQTDSGKDAPAPPAPVHHKTPLLIFEMSDQTAEFDAAMAKAQGQFANPQKNRTVEVKMKNGGKYDFQYATLDRVIDALRQPIAENGIWYTQVPAMTERGLVLITRVAHSSGQWLKTSIPIDMEENGIQALGSAVSYLRRYVLTSIFGIASEEDDDDGGAASGHATTDKPSAQRAPLKTSSPPPSPRTSGVRSAPPISAADPSPFDDENPLAIVPKTQPTEPRSGTWFYSARDQLAAFKLGPEVDAWEDANQGNLVKLKERWPEGREILAQIMAHLVRTLPESTLGAA